jgi:glycosyltransferase involved in cell wall biosynthesis
MRVGIVIPAWNVAPVLAKTIRSVLAQTHADWRMVIVDDGSTDGTHAVVAPYPDTRIRLMRQANAGVSVARNRGLLELDPAAGAVLFLDGDDCLAPDALARLVATLNAMPDAVAAAGPYLRDGEDWRGPCRPPSGDILTLLLVRNRFANLGHVLIRRAAAAQVGSFRPGLAYGEDWDYLVRLALLGRFARAPGATPVLHVRVRPGGACHRLALDPAAFQDCLAAIFTNPALLARLGPSRLATMRRHAEAESFWIIGRELIRHGREGLGRPWLRRSVRALPSPRRLLLLATAHALTLLPPLLRGPFVPYPEV